MVKGEMNKLKKFIDCNIATETCNLRCHYCYITQKRKFNNKLVQFNHSPSEIRKALSVDRMGGVCLINMCAGGETLLAWELLDVIKELLKEGHYVMVVTNGLLSERFEEISKFPSDLLKRLFFKFSFHWMELVRLNKMDVFFNNVNMMQGVGCSFTVELTTCDELIPHIEDIKKECMRRLGTLCHLTIARDVTDKSIRVLSKYEFKDYKLIWSSFKSDLFDFKSTIFYKKRREFCYAGDWTLYLDLMSGQLKQCYCGREIDNIYVNVDMPLRLEAVGTKCTLPHCYNGHAFLTLGAIPEFVSPTYADMRDRKSSDGKCWLQPDMKAFMSQKLVDNNEEYSEVRKIISDFRNMSVPSIPIRGIRKLVRMLNAKK